MGLVAPVPAHNVCDGSVEELCASVVFFFVGFGQAGEREPSGASDNSWGGRVLFLVCREHTVFCRVTGKCNGSVHVFSLQLL